MKFLKLAAFLRVLRSAKVDEGDLKYMDKLDNQLIIYRLSYRWTKAKEAFSSKFNHHFARGKIIAYFCNHVLKLAIIATERMYITTLIVTVRKSLLLLRAYYC